MYKIRLECGNCYHRESYEIPFGIPHNDADILCPNCKCAPNSLEYKVVDFNMMGRYEKETVQKGANDAKE